MSNGLYEVTVYIDGLFEYHRLVRPSNTVENNTLHIMDNQSRIALVRVGEAFPDDGAPEKKVKYLLADHLGSSNVVLDETGYVINREEYYPFGETSFGSFARKRYRFTGKERDEQSGFYYHGARYYAPWFCRWISCDPAGLLDGSNVYIYVSNNPIRKSDPTGNQGIDTQELMMGMMWDRMGQEFSAMIESVIGGRAYVSPSQNRVEYSGPQGGLGGAFGGVTRTMSLRTIPVERNPTEVSLMGMEVGASLVPVLDPAERLVAGTTVTGQKTSIGCPAFRS
jgi:RHS repeat-associated protein